MERGAKYLQKLKEDNPENFKWKIIGRVVSIVIKTDVKISKKY